ncbi:hypothetical protein VTO42DRAFT_2037 [Malbranchea cinnamomea]
MASLNPFILPPRKRGPIPIIHPSGQVLDVNALAQQQQQRQQQGEEACKKPNNTISTTPLSSETPAPFSGLPEKTAAETSSNTTSASAPLVHTATDSTKSRLSSTSHKAPKSGQWTPDLYAPAYVPLYLLAINQSPAIDRACTPLKMIDFDTYIRSFAGDSVLGPVAVRQMPPIQKVTVSLSRHARRLSPSNYPYYFNECLLMETYSHSVELSHLNLYNVKVQVYAADRQLYQLKVPGIKDDAPKINLGDIVLIRQIVPSPQLPQQGADWYNQRLLSSDRMIAPGFTGQQHHAVVWGAYRAKETVVLRIDHFLPSLLHCNVIFQVQPDFYTPLWSAISRVSNGYSMEWPGPDLKMYGEPSGGIENHSSWMRHMLFPEPEDAALQTELSRGSFPHKWADPQLNVEQMKAVDAIISRNYGSVPFLISGVPGSGKTKTLVECTLQLLKSSGDIQPHILVCAPSNPAADTLALRLSLHLDQRELFRMNGYTRSFAEVPARLMPFTYVTGETFSLPDFKTMMQYKVVVTTCIDSDMLVRARLTNADLMKLTFETVLPVAPGISLTPEKALHWTALVLDEAAQATEPSVCVPLTVVANPFAVEQSPEGHSSLPLVIMAGDQHQLGPRVFNTDTALSVSLFERLSSRPIYADHPFSRRNAGRYKRLTKDMLPIPRAAFTNLVRNYRSHQAILAIPSVLFYSDTLVPASKPVDPSGPVLTWPGWKSPHRWPILFACNTAPDDVEEVLHSPAGSGLYNPEEARKALNYVKSLLQHSKGFIKPDEITVISPFNSQVAHLRDQFRSHGLWDVNIGPLEAFQGLETRFLIICTTRTRTDPRFVEQDQALGLGLIGERKRFNVALTRAKEGVVVIGNPSLLGTGPVRDEAWHAFLSFCARNGCWEAETGDTNREMNQTQRSRSSNRGENGAAEAKRSASYWAKKLSGILEHTQGPESHGGAEMHDLRFHDAYVSSLEYALLYDEKVEQNANNERQLGGDQAPADDAQDSAMWVSGFAAEHVLKGVWDDDE